MTEITLTAAERAYDTWRQDQDQPVSATTHDAWLAGYAACQKAYAEIGDRLSSTMYDFNEASQELIDAIDAAIGEE